MKKLFFLAAAMLVSAGMFAETETVGKASADKADWVGTCATIGREVMTNSASSGYVKMRTSVSDTIIISVNSGYKITGLSIQAYSNNEEATIGLKSISYDGGDNVVASMIELPTSKAKPSAPQFENSTNKASSAIVLGFDNSNIDPENTKAKNKQIMAIINLTYEVTATTYTATYKANNGTEDKDSVDTKALKVAGPIFKKANAYFVGWNTAADGTGTPYEIGAALTADVTLYAQWKNFVAEKTMTIASSGETPAKDAAVALAAGSTGGWMTFYSAKVVEGNEDYTTFSYNAKGLAFDGGAANVVKVILDSYLKAGSVICINLIARADGGGLNILDKDGNAKFAATGNKSNDVQYFYYEVKAGDGLEGTNEFRLQRAGGCYLKAVALAGLGAATAIDNTAAEVKTVKTFENGQLIIIKNGVKYNATGAIVK